MAIDNGAWYPELPDTPPLDDWSAGGPDAPASGSDAHLRGSGSPVGVVTPEFENQQYLDETNVPVILYQASGLTNADWTQVT